MTPQETAIVLAATRLHSAVAMHGKASVEAEIALGELIAAVDRVIFSRPPNG